MSDLKPCPFCGEAVHINRFLADGNQILSYLMHDEQQGCPLVCTANYANDDIAIAAWNTRQEGDR